MSRRHILSRWFKHRAKAKGLNSIHSPFVFKMMTELKRNIAPSSTDDIERRRRELKKDRRVISVDDYGAGSQKLTTRERRIAHIARTSVKPKKHALLLYRLGHYLGAKNILELGTSLGITTMYMASLNAQAKESEEVKVFTIEGSEAIADVAKEGFKQFEFGNIHPYIGRFENRLDDVLREMDTVDLVFLDGNHKKLPTKNYLNIILEQAHDETVFVLDDIYWSKEMSECWETLIEDERFHVSIDLFHFGILIPRRHQAKEHFRLRV